MKLRIRRSQRTMYMSPKLDTNRNEKRLKPIRLDRIRPAAAAVWRGYDDLFTEDRSPAATQALRSRAFAYWLSFNPLTDSPDSSRARIPSLPSPPWCLAEKRAG
jgi:hypothetical protein